MIDRLKEFRKKYFNSQLDFANALKVSRPMISEYENGKTSISLDKLNVLATVYKLNLNWLISGQGSMILNDVESSDLHRLNTELDRLKIENNLLKELLKKN